MLTDIILNNCIGVRNYQILDKNENSSADGIQLIEIGPRFVLVPIRIFNGSLGGATLYQNTAFVSPNEERSLMKKNKGDRYKQRVEHVKFKKEYDETNKPEINELSNAYLFKEN